MKRIRRLPDVATLLTAHESAWRVLRNEFTVLLATDSEQIEKRPQLALNVNTFHVLQSAAAVTADLDAGLPARGLHGEGYRGHIFWDEMFVYPTLSLHRPEITRALLGYRYRWLGEAREAARRAGHKGAMFPWQSGIDGRDESRPNRSTCVTTAGCPIIPGSSGTWGWPSRTARGSSTNPLARSAIWSRRGLS
ncbi:hypothetical protein [Mycetocola miduiensis]|uniref:hypothetical protein n=1 Tax=Mycetocola miduiensis TaxID=995034 RepID=UPI002481C5D0|nr:hypothetical protein [Mycetocola miduiensis]